MVLSQHLIAKLESNTPRAWRWLTHPVKAVDGSSVSMAGTPRSRTGTGGLGVPPKVFQRLMHLTPDRLSRQMLLLGVPGPRGPAGR